MASGVWYSNQSYPGVKICKAVYCHSDDDYEIVGISDTKNTYHMGRLPASYLIPQDDPQYNKDGSSALGLYGYMLNSRCWIYDAGLALLVFTQAGDYDICREMQNRLSKRDAGVYSDNMVNVFRLKTFVFVGKTFQVEMILSS